MAVTVINEDSKLDRIPRFNTGESDFKSIILGDFAYVDKTHFIKRWWDSGTKISLIVRPRRFSKTTIMSTVKYYFSAKDLKFLFGDTYIYKNAPVDLVAAREEVIPIMLTFKGIVGKTPRKLFKGLHIQIRLTTMDYPELYSEFGEEYEKFPSIGETLEDCEDLLALFTLFLHYIYKSTDKKLIVLIDEYDKFLADAALVSEKGEHPDYFDEVLDVYRSFLVSLLKDTEFVERAILTGVLPLAANSVLSAFNNAVKDTFLQTTYEDVFGFTIKELTAIFSAAKGEEWKQAIQYFDSYNSGTRPVYNTWSIINMSPEKDDIWELYTTGMNTWVTSGSSDWIEYGKNLSSDELDIVYNLISGGEHTVRLNHELNYKDRKDSLDNFLTYAFYTGYLTFTSHEKDSVSLAIPNAEVKDAWVRNLNKLVIAPDKSVNWGKILADLEEGAHSERKFEALLMDFLEQCTSTWDLQERDKENSYHMYVLGLLSSLVGSHNVKSNREAGKGRFDIAVEPTSFNYKARNYVFEIKRSSSENKLQSDVDDAVAQVAENNYRQFFENSNDMVVIGLAAHKKKVKVKIKVIPYEISPIKQALR
ncbi:AAA family ATPase [Paenibacillus sp. GYB006]|uniref:AAA family ATPase n=1 Tax=Paenibacillus sp. GYB006 TaxID=2994394 RepID=UPI002F96A1D7